MPEKNNYYIDSVSVTILKITKDGILEMVARD